MAVWAVFGMVDCNGPNDVEVRVSQHNGKLRLWVNVDGICAFRAYDAPKVVIHALAYDPIVVEPKEEGHDPDRQD